ncbi:MAG: GTPase Era [Thermodesulfovibrionales bacterium]|nr:GTPase Era [Thermodesulfovibrionales bacterium]
MTEETGFKSGFVAIIGRPNVGKSTLLNTLMGEKISIVSSKPQTTRKRIRGILNIEGAQIVFVDTPGMHKPLHKLGERMLKEVTESLDEVDVIIFMIDNENRRRADLKIIEMLKSVNKPVILVINKIDLIKKPNLLPIIDDFRKLHDFKEIIPITTKEQSAVQLLLKCLLKYIPAGPKYYEDDIITDQYIRSMAGEIIREKILQNTEEEVPHSVAVDITNWLERDDGTLLIRAEILVERDGQKAIIIGAKGTLIKKIGTSARMEIEELTGKKVFLDLWVKVKKDWREDEKILKELGY